MSFKLFFKDSIYIYIYTSNGDLRRKQSNHKTDESMKIGQSVGFFGQLFLVDTPLSQKK